MLGAGAAVGALAVVAAVGVWRDREALGARLAIDALRRRGVPAAVHVTRLDAGGVEGSLALGPPGRPDLTVDRFRADFDPWPAAGGGPVAPRLRRLVLHGAHLRAAWDGRRLTVGSLQPLLDDALRAPPGGGGGGPDVELDAATLDLATPYGPVRATGGAHLAAGRLADADLALTADALAGPRGAGEGARATGLVARLRARMAEGDRLALRLTAVARSASGDGAAATGLTATAAADLPCGRDARNGLDGHVVVTAALAAARTQARGVALQGARLHGRFDGVLDRGGEHAVGAAQLGLEAARVSARGAALTSAAVTVSTDALDAFAARGGAAVRAPFALALTVAGGEAPAPGGRATLGSTRVAARGRLAYGRGLRVDGALSATGSGGLDAAAAARLASAVSPGEAGRAPRAVLQQALGQIAVSAPAVAVSLRDTAWRAALQAPLRAKAAGGGRLVAGVAEVEAPGGGRASGRLSADLDGGGLPAVRLRAPALTLRAGPGGPRLDAPGVELAAEGSAGPLQGARLDFAGRLAAAPGSLTAVAARCLPLSIARVEENAPEPLAADISARACPDGAAPMLELGHGGWRVSTRLEALALAAPGARLQVSGASGRLRLAGCGAGLEGGATLAASAVRDTSAPLRFPPLTLSGRASFAGQAVRADLAAALQAGAVPLGPVQVTQRLDTGAGALTLDAPALVFAPDGLQPAALVPALAPFGHAVRGTVAASLALGWGPAGPTGSARVRTAGLDLVSAAGPLHGVATDLTFTSLDPLVTAPAQTVTAARLDALAPLTDLSATFALTPDALKLARAGATLAGGRVTLDPLRLPLAPGATVSGVARADGVRLGALLDTVNLSRALEVEASVRGALPFSVGPAGLRVTGGELAAQGPGRLTLHRTALTGVSAGGGPAGAPPSAAQDFAFQALEDLAFTALDARVDSRPAGRLGVVLHVKGRHDPALGRPARVRLIDLLRGHAFDKAIPLPKGTDVDLTLDTSLNFDDLYRAWLELGAARSAGGDAAPRPAGGSAKVQP